MQNSELTEEDSFSDKPLLSALSGLLYATFVIAVSTGMLLINAVLCLTVFSALPEIINEEVTARVGQMFFFIAPVLLMVLEWHLIDRVQRLFRTED